MFVCTSLHVELSALSSIGQRKELRNCGCLTLLVKWAMVLGILAESVSIPLFIPKENKNPLLLHSAREAEVGWGQRYQVKHILEHLERTTKMIKCLENSTQYKSALTIYCALRKES